MGYLWFWSCLFYFILSTTRFIVYFYMVALPPSYTRYHVPIWIRFLTKRFASREEFLFPREASILPR